MSTEEIPKWSSGQHFDPKKHIDFKWSTIRREIAIYLTGDGEALIQIGRSKPIKGSKAKGLAAAIRYLARMKAEHAQSMNHQEDEPEKALDLKHQELKIFLQSQGLSDSAWALESGYTNSLVSLVKSGRRTVPKPMLRFAFRVYGVMLKNSTPKAKPDNSPEFEGLEGVMDKFLTDEQEAEMDEKVRLAKDNKATQGIGDL